MNLKRVVYAGVLTALCSIPMAYSQPSDDVIFDKRITIEAPDGLAEGDGPGPGTVMFIASEFGMPDKTVKGAPYSAEAVTEHIQELADGNRIVQKTTSQIYRDSEGRTRREQEFGPIGPFAHGDSPRSSIFINDPVKNQRFVYEPDGTTVRKMKQRAQWTHAAPGQHVPPPTADVVIQHAPPPQGDAPVMMKYSEEGESQKESLGKQFIEGVEAEGTRTTITIPAGQIGNERDIQIVSEKWFSQELQVNVMTRHADPRFGETVYKLRNVNRSEPAPGLFEIPQGYKVEDAPEGDRITIKKKIQN